MFARALRWLIPQWPYASLLVASLLLLLLPLWWSAVGLVQTLVFAQLLIYLLHQCEEHFSDRFRRFVNQYIAGGLDALTPTTTFWINALGVWGVDIIALYLAWFVGPGLGLIAVYLTLVNALVHIGGGIALRRYNPGLATALVLFLPIGGWALVVIAQTGASWVNHIMGIAIAVLIHVVLIVHVQQRVAMLRRNTVVASRRR